MAAVMEVDCKWAKQGELPVVFLEEFPWGSAGEKVLQWLVGYGLVCSLG